MSTVEPSVPEDVTPVLAMGDGDPLERSSISVESAVRRMHTTPGHATMPDMTGSESSTSRHGCSVTLLLFSMRCCDAPLRYLAMNVKRLSGWEADVRIKSVNIVDEASNLQRNNPFFESERSEVLLGRYRHWTRAYGRPRWLKVDASRTNLGETLQRALEADGTQFDVPSQAYEQVGRVEIHGRYFEDLLMTVLAHIKLSWICRRSRSGWNVSHKLFNQSDVQTEDGHAMVEFDTFQSFAKAEPRSAWVHLS